MFSKVEHIVAAEGRRVHALKFARGARGRTRVFVTSVATVQLPVAAFAILDAEALVRRPRDEAGTAFELAVRAEVVAIGLIRSIVAVACSVASE